MIVYNYKALVLDILKHGVCLTVECIYQATNSHYGAKIISELKKDGHKIIHSKRRNLKSKKFYYVWFIGRVF